MTTTKVTEAIFFFRFFDVIVLRMSDILLTSSGIVKLDCVDSKRRFSSENIGTQGFFFAPKFSEVVGTYEWYFVILWMQVQWWGYHEVFGTLKHHLMQKNLDSQEMGMGTNARATACPLIFFKNMSQHWVDIPYIHNFLNLENAPPRKHAINDWAVTLFLFM